MAMFWKRCNPIGLWLALFFIPISGLPAQVAKTPVAPAPAASLAPVKFIRAVDVDHQNFAINRKNHVTFVVCTGPDSQDDARTAGQDVYDFQGRKDFQLVVVVDLRGSMAGMLPGLAESSTQRSLDDEARNLKPYFLKNHNLNNPRNTMHVVLDFDGKTCMELGWGVHRSNLRASLYDATGRLIQSWETLPAPLVVQTAIKQAIDKYAAARNKPRYSESSPNKDEENSP